MRTSRSPELWKMVKPMNAINIKGKENVTVSEETRAFIDENLQNLPEDNGLLLRRIRERFDRVGLNLPTVEVRFENLFVGAVCDVVGGKPLLTLTNALKSSISVDGDVSYNGFKLEDFIPQKTSAYVRQHIPELTVRETLDFSARCQGSGSRANLLVELEKSEKEAGIVPDSNLDAYMKAISISGAERTPETDYILKVLGLETCSDVIIGDAMKRGISGGEKKRLTLGHFKERSSTILVFLRPVGAKAIRGTFRASIHVERQQGRKLMQISSGDVSIGENVMRRKGLPYQDYFYWICIGALIGFTVIFDVVFTLALTYLRAPSNRRAVISLKKLSQLQRGDYCNRDNLHKISSSSVSIPVSSMEQKRGKMIFPFEPLTLCFKGVQYFVESPSKMRNQDVTHKTIQLLRDVTGVFRPQVLVALMGVSGAGKTTLLDVLSGRKTSGVIQGDIYVGGNTKEFVNEVLETIELDEIKDTLVGIPGVSGLSLEQCKRLTLAVELVANPSILFIDEPTMGLDARSAAIVMRAVRNGAETGRTVVCTIHQPSIDIFESFDELILIKKGGQIIYSGQLGWHSDNVINYLSIPGVPKIKDNYSPAIRMPEVTSTSMERQLGLDFAQIYKDSCLCRETEVLVEQLSKSSRLKETTLCHSFCCEFM